MKLSYFSFPKRYGGNIRVIFSNDTIKFTKKNYLYIEKKEKKFFLKLKNMKSKILRWKRKTYEKKGYDTCWKGVSWKSFNFD